MADGFIPLSADPMRGDFAPTFLIAALDAARREAASAAEAPAPPPPAMPDPLAERVAEAHRAGHAAGRAEALAEGAASRQAMAADTAGMALALLQDTRMAAGQIVDEAARDVAALVVSVLDAALPGLAARNGAALAAEFARRLAPMIETALEARILVARGLAGETRALLGEPAFRIEEDASLPPGDARAEWRGGGAAFDLAARRHDISLMLAAAGIAPTE